MATSSFFHELLAERNVLQSIIILGRYAHKVRRKDFMTNKTNQNTNSVATTVNAVSTKKMNEESVKRFREYQKQYMKDHYKQYSIRLNIEEDKEIIEYIEKLDNFAQFVRKATAICKVIDSFN